MAIISRFKQKKGWRVNLTQEFPPGSVYFSTAIDPRKTKHISEKTTTYRKESWGEGDHIACLIHVEVKNP